MDQLMCFKFDGYLHNYIEGTVMGSLKSVFLLGAATKAVENIELSSWNFGPYMWMISFFVEG